MAKSKISTSINERSLANRLRRDFKGIKYQQSVKNVAGKKDQKGVQEKKGVNFILLYAYNGTGKTRLSGAFKDVAKNKGKADTLYFNAFTEDLFTWHNDLESDRERYLKINSQSEFFKGFEELALEQKIADYLSRYTTFDFNIDYDAWKITFSKENQDNIKISRGEENIFIWCIFLAIMQLAIEEDEAYKWVKYFYIDDPISSLDDNNAIIVANDLAKLLKNEDNKLKAVISSHHSLFFNVMCNELRNSKYKQYFLYKANDSESYTLRTTNETPFFHHIAMLDELKKAVKSNKLYTYHFNILRSILEKTAVFFGFEYFSDCIKHDEDKDLYARALNVLSHGKYSIYEPMEMNDDNKNLFKDILNVFLDKYQFDLPQLHQEKK